MKKVFVILLSGLLLSACNNSEQKQAEEKQNSAQFAEQQKNTSEMLYQALQTGNLEQIKKYTTAHCYQLITAKPDTIKQMQALIPTEKYKEKNLIATSSASSKENNKSQKSLTLGYEYKYENKSIIYFVGFNDSQDFSKVDDIKLQEKMSE